MGSAWVVKVPYGKDAASLDDQAGVNLKALLSGNRYRHDYNDDYYRQTLLPEIYRRLKTVLAGLEATAVIAGTKSLEETTRRTRSTIYPDSVGIGHCD